MFVPATFVTSSDRSLTLPMIFSIVSKDSLIGSMLICREIV